MFALARARAAYVAQISRASHEPGRHSPGHGRAPARSRSRRLDPALLGIGAVLLLLVLAAVLTPPIAPYPPDQGNILIANAPPSAAHLLGTDALGRDILSRLIYGARLSLLGPALPYIARVLRSVALRERHLAYIESCQLVGYSGWAIWAASLFWEDRPRV